MQDHFTKNAQSPSSMGFSRCLAATVDSRLCAHFSWGPFEDRYGFVTHKGDVGIPIGEAPASGHGKRGSRAGSTVEKSPSSTTALSIVA